MMDGRGETQTRWRSGSGPLGRVRTSQFSCRVKADPKHAHVKRARESERKEDGARTLARADVGRIPQSPGITERHRPVQASSSQTAFITGNDVWNQT